MKKLMRLLLLAAILSALLCVGALAADSEPVKGGIYNITGSVTLTPKDASGGAITAGSSDGVADSGYYANAVKFDVKAENLTKGQQYLLLVLKGGADGSAPGVPTADNIAYIDQMAATETGVDFTAYPKELTKGTYHVYLVGGGTAFAQSQVASFEYDQKYTLGDVDNDNAINAVDASWILQYAVNRRTLTDIQFCAADIDKDGFVNAVDAGNILQYAVGRPSLLD